MLPQLSVYIIVLTCNCDFYCLLITTVVWCLHNFKTLEWYALRRIFLTREYTHSKYTHLWHITLKYTLTSQHSLRHTQPQRYLWPAEVANLRHILDMEPLRMLSLSNSSSISNTASRWDKDMVYQLMLLLKINVLITLLCWVCWECSTSVDPSNHDAVPWQMSEVFIWVSRFKMQNYFMTLNCLFSNVSPCWKPSQCRLMDWLTWLHVRAQIWIRTPEWKDGCACIIYSHMRYNSCTLRCLIYIITAIYWSY